MQTGIPDREKPEKDRKTILREEKAKKEKKEKDRRSKKSKGRVTKGSNCKNQTRIIIQDYQYLNKWTVKTIIHYYLFQISLRILGPRRYS